MVFIRGKRVAEVRRMMAVMASLAVMAMTAAPANAQSTIENWIQSFADSEIQFSRARTNAPFIPMAWIDATRYSDTDVDTTAITGQTASYDQTVVSQGLLAPFLLSPRDMLIVGEWANWTDFEVQSANTGDFKVTSFGLPVGWIHQNSDEWQTIAFVMPLGSDASLPGSSWSWEYMGGVFGRYTQKDNLWWAFGIFADVGPGDDLLLPYVGASWTIDDKWTLSAILPWPSIIYAPNTNTMFSIGLSPSGASWGIDAGSGNATYNLDAIDAGFNFGKRVYRNFWVNLEAGVGGMRALSISGGSFDGQSVKIDSSSFIRLGFNYRPSLQPFHSTN